MHYQSLFSVATAISSTLALEFDFVFTHDLQVPSVEIFDDARIEMGTILVIPVGCRIHLSGVTPVFELTNTGGIQPVPCTSAPAEAPSAFG